VSRALLLGRVWCMSGQPVVSRVPSRDVNVLYFLFLQEQIKDIIIIPTHHACRVCTSPRISARLRTRKVPGRAEDHQNNDRGTRYRRHSTCPPAPPVGQRRNALQSARRRCTFVSRAHASGPATTRQHKCNRRRQGASLGRGGAGTATTCRPPPW